GRVVMARGTHYLKGNQEIITAYILQLSLSLYT
ncbi:hypothetical protein L195_g064083, partial [Trifolium pratense]